MKVHKIFCLSLGFSPGFHMMRCVAFFFAEFKVFDGALKKVDFGEESFYTLCNKIYYNKFVFFSEVFYENRRECE